MNFFSRPLRAIALGLGIATAALPACSARQRVAVETTAAKLLVPTAQEEQIGAQLHQELEQKEGLRYVNDPAVTSYVENIAKRILEHASKDRSDITWKVFVVDDPKTVNAFATPGGYLYVMSGLILAVENEAEIAGVLAHEAGHVIGRHSARQMVNAFGLETIAALALGENPGLIQQIGASLAGNGLMLAHSRSDENEADTYGVQYASAAGWDPLESTCRHASLSIL